MTAHNARQRTCEWTAMKSQCNSKGTTFVGSQKRGCEAGTKGRGSSLRGMKLVEEVHNVGPINLAIDLQQITPRISVQHHYRRRVCYEVRRCLGVRMRQQ